MSALAIDVTIRQAKDDGDPRKVLDELHSLLDTVPPDADDELDQRTLERLIGGARFLAHFKTKLDAVDERLRDNNLPGI